MIMGRKIHKKMLFLFAHPDDESYGAGGTIAKYASQGVEIYLVSATNGEKCRINRVGASDLGATRKRELIEAGRVLGVRKTYFLDYPDRYLNTVSPKEIKARLGEIMERVRPQIVVTFDSHGITGHPDHQAISRFTTEVFYELKACGPDADTDKDFFLWKLYYLTIPSRWLLTVPLLLNSRVRRKYRGTPLRSITTEIDVSDFKHLKRKACQCHASQFNNFRGVNRYVGSKFFKKEYFVLANPSGFRPRAKGREKDLFEGIFEGIAD